MNLSRAGYVKLANRQAGYLLHPLIRTYGAQRSCSPRENGSASL